MRLDQQSLDAIPIVDYDQLRNINCHEYFYNLLSSTFSDDESIAGEPSAFSFLQKFRKHEIYDAKYAYGDLYTQFFYALEHDIENTHLVWPSGKKALLLNGVFFNENKALERASCLKNLSPPTSPINMVTPEDMDSITQKVRTMVPGMIANSLFGGWAVSGALSYLGATEAFKPMFGTSMISVKKYDYRENSSDSRLIELRSGTQAQYQEDGTARLNPVFDAWLKSQYETNPEMHCIYFNNLGYDVPVIKSYQEAVVGVSARAERSYERNLTLQLHAAEARHSNLIMITLPADKGLLHSRAYLSTDPLLSVKQAVAQMLAIASLDHKATIDVSVKDFYMSDATEKKIYASQREKNDTLNTLISESFLKILDIAIDQQGDKVISQAEYQAVYFHFIKYELTHFILEKFSLKTLIFACKDGIDRAGAASLYYNLICSIRAGMPFTMDEFDRALDAAPKYVKGRSMNHHRTILWNVIHHLLSASVIAVPQWLEEWHALNIPEKLKTNKTHITP